MSNNDLITQPSPLPTRKLTAASAFTALTLAITEAIFGILPTSSPEVRDAVQVLIDSGFAALIGFILPLLGGYFPKDKKVG